VQHPFVTPFFCNLKQKKALLWSAGQPYRPDSHTAQNSTLPTLNRDISTTMAKKKPKVDENKMQEALKDYFDDGDKSIAQTAKEYGIQRRTMQDRINSLPAKIGKKAHNRALSKI
jgi:hypothetical protein